MQNPTSNLANKINFIESFVSTLNIKRNVIKDRLYIKSDEGFRYFCKKDFADILRSLRMHGVSCSKTLLEEILESSFIEDVNEIEDFFKTERLKCSGAITQLAYSVETENPALWAENLKKWMVAAVAQVLGAGTNHTCLVLVGEQGTQKSTWLNNLIPSQLRKDYLYTGVIDPRFNKDVLAMLCEMWIINIDDQLQDLTKESEAMLKSIITSPFVVYRKPYDKMAMQYKRIASFVGSTNYEQYLSDVTGNRRFLSHKVRNCNLVEDELIKQAWAEAYTLLNAGFQYWFTRKDIEQLQNQNESFETENLEASLFNRYFSFEKTEFSSIPIHLTNSEILATLQKNAVGLRLSARKLGIFLKKNQTPVLKRVNNSTLQLYTIYEKQR